MRNLVVCCDGTWNTPDQKHDGVPVPTNVVRLHNALSETNDVGVRQLRYYHPGVGTEGTWWEKVAGGTVGVGLSSNVMSAYKWLGVTYEPDDRIYLFGFSRGAYTVRSLAGMMCRCGLLDLSGLHDADVWARVKQAYDRGYRKKEQRAEWAAGWSFHGAGDPEPLVRVFFLGVWDTVGALGVPNDMAILNLLDNVKKWAFHDANLSDEVHHARHAVALDEERASFSPSLWMNVEDHADARQMWFPGVHCDVGGGYAEKGLSDGALKWMIDEAKDCDLGFHEGMVAQVEPNHLDVLHDSRTGLFEYLRTQPRSVPLVAAENQGTILHDSVIGRQETPPIAQAPYRSTNRLATAGDSAEVDVFAARIWNETGVYLEAGVTYRFEATGQWVDRNITCGPGGTDDGDFQVGELAHLAGALWGKAEGLFRKLTKNDKADFRGTRREEKMPWFVLVGVVANGGNPRKDGTPAPHETFRIGAGGEHSPGTSGYLYCFANDAWHFYGNNHGSVRLKVTRLP